jgi:hypothetical protein
VSLCIEKETTMMRLIPKLCFAVLVGAGVTLATPLPSFAQTQMKTETKKTMSLEEKKAKSKECSTLADQKGLHGKERKAFRSKCKRGES